MKKYLFILMGLVLSLSFVACTDQDDVEISYESGIEVSAKDLFSSFQELTTGDFDLTAHQDYELEISVYIYDSNGDLKDHFSQTFKNIDTPLKHNGSYTPGNYTIISLARFINKDQNYRWNIDEKDRLNEFSISASDKLFNDGQFETLGMDVSSFSVTNLSQKKEIRIKPLTALVSGFLIGQDLKSSNSADKFSYFAYGCSDVSVLSPTLYQSIKFDGSNIEYSHGTYSTTYNISKFNPLEMVNDGSSTNTYEYRAILPSDDVQFYFTITFGAGEQILETSGPLSEHYSIASGDQFDVDIVLDGLFHWTGFHDPNMDFGDKVLKYRTIVVEDAYNAIMSQNWMGYFGFSKDFILALPEFSEGCTYSYNEYSGAIYDHTLTISGYHSYYDICFGLKNDKVNYVMLILNRNICGDLLDKKINDVFAESYDFVAAMSTDKLSTYRYRPTGSSIVISYDSENNIIAYWKLY